MNDYINSSFVRILYLFGENKALEIVIGWKPWEYAGKKTKKTHTKKKTKKKWVTMIQIWIILST